MDNLGKRAQQELMAQIDATLEKLQRYEPEIEQNFEVMQKAVRKKKRKIQKKTIAEARNIMVGNLRIFDREIVKLRSLDRQHKMINSYLQSISEWTETLKSLDPKIKAIAEYSFWGRKKAEVNFDSFTSKAIRIIGLPQ